MTLKMAIHERTKQMKTKKGLLVFILKSGGKSYDGKANFSSRVDKAVLLPSSDFPDVPEIFEPSNDAPAVVMVKRKIFGGKPAYLTAYPADVDGNPDNVKVCRMAGGCYIEACDSRFPAEYPVPLHDRTE